jgi:hypothetical protein
MSEAKAVLRPSSPGSTPKPTVTTVGYTLARLRRSSPIVCADRHRHTRSGRHGYVVRIPLLEKNRHSRTRSGRKVAERRQRVAAGVNPQFRAPDMSQVAKRRQVDTTWFDKWFYQAIYWYMIEMLAQKLKTGELSNPKIYEFNPGVVYNNQAQRTKNQEQLQTGIPLPGKKHHQTAAR